MNVPDQVDERKDKIPMQTSQQSWLSISQKMKKVHFPAYDGNNYFISRTSQ